MTGDATATTSGDLPLTVTERLLRSRGALLFLVLLVTAPVLVYHAARNVTATLAAPDIGLHVTSLATVQVVDPRWPGVQLDDRVVELNGQPVRRVLDFERARRAAPRGEVTASFERDGRTVSLRSHTTEWDTAYRISVWIRIATGAMLILIGLVAFVLRPVGVVSWLFLLGCYNLGFLLLSTYVFENLIVVAILLYPLLSLASSLLVHLFLVFPTPAKFITENPRRVLLAYLPGVLFTPLTYAWFFPDEPWHFLWRIGDAFIWGYMVVASALVAVWLVIRSREAKGRQDRLAGQYRILGIAILLGFLLPTVLIMGNLVFGAWADQRWIYDAALAATMAFPALLGYAIVRHNALAVDRFTASIVGYGATVFVLAAGYAVVLVWAISIARDLGVSSEPPVVATMTAAVMATVGPLYRRVKRQVDRWFRREHATAERTLAVVTELRARFQDTHGGDACTDLAFETLQSIKPETIELWRLSEDGERISLARSAGDVPGERATSVPAQGPLCVALRKGKSGGLRPLCQVSLDDRAGAQLWDLRLAAVAPLRADGRLLGFLGLGRRTSGTPYSAEEVALLSNVGHELAGVLVRDADGGSRIGRYRIEKRLGVGGMAEVFLAWHVGPGGFERRVALKRPLPDVAEEPRFVSMFLDEARIAASLQHENIAQVYEVDRDERTFFMAMEYVDGPTLRSVLRRCALAGRPVPVSVAARLMEGLLGALEHVHGKRDASGELLGLVHRDLNGNNILLTRAGLPKIVDFGIADAASKLFRTQTGVVRGTLPYMSPEQALAKPVDLRSDIYSAGVLAYEILTLHRPFPQGPMVQRPPKASMLRRELSAAVDEAIARAIAHAPEERFASAVAFREALQASLTDTEASDKVMAEWLASVPEPPPEEAAARAPDPEAATADVPANTRETRDLVV